MKKLILIMCLSTGLLSAQCNVPLDFQKTHIEQIKEFAEQHKKKYPTNYYMQEILLNSDIESMYRVYKRREELGLSN